MYKYEHCYLFLLRLYCYYKFLNDNIQFTYVKQCIAGSVSDDRQ